MANNEKFLRMSMTPREWFNIEESEGEAEIYIYDQIGADFWGDGLSAKDFIAQLKEIKSKTLALHINSPGGYVNEGKAIYNALKNLRGVETTSHIDGLAASVASWFPMATDKTIINANAQIMIHDPWGFAIGDSREMRETADLLDREKIIIVNMYASGTDIDPKRLADMMAEETWMSADEAVDLGFADEINGNARLAACVFDLGLFDNLPDAFLRQQSALSKRTLESDLRDVGWSKAEATRIASGPRRDSEGDEADDAELADLINANIAKLENTK